MGAFVLRVDLLGCLVLGFCLWLVLVLLLGVGLRLSHFGF